MLKAGRGWRWRGLGRGWWRFERGMLLYVNEKKENQVIFNLKIKIMSVNLSPGDLAIEYGIPLPPLSVNNISVQIITQSTQGTITHAQLQVVYDIDPALVTSPNTGNDPHGYALRPNQVGFPSHHQLHDVQGGDVMSVTYAGNTPYLNLKLPLANAKRDWGN